MNCPLCETATSDVFYSAEEKIFGQLQARTYYKCGECSLIFLEASQRVSAEAEKERYESHNNNLEDEEYLVFLRKLWVPLTGGLLSKSRGLDYGCGPVKAMEMFAKAKAFIVSSYDPFFWPDKKVLDDLYDFIICSEVFEHLFSPGKEFENLLTMLKPGGRLGIMTGIYNDSIDFKSWTYRQDITHVCFYQKETMQWLAKKHSKDLQFVNDTVCIFT